MLYAALDHRSGDDDSAEDEEGANSDAMENDNADDDGKEDVDDYYDVIKVDDEYGHLFADNDDVDDGYGEHQQRRVIPMRAHNHECESFLTVHSNAP
jgi:hypothetical protein